MKTLKHYKAFLDLHMPVALHIKTRTGKDCDAYYMPRYNSKGKLKQHDITIYTENCEREFNTLLAHELIHAKQEELEYADTHGPSFRKYARKLAKEFNLKKIYRKTVDKP